MKMRSVGSRTEHEYSQGEFLYRGSWVWALRHGGISKGIKGDDGQKNQSQG